MRGSFSIESLKDREWREDRFGFGKPFLLLLSYKLPSFSLAPFPSALQRVFLLFAFPLVSPNLDADKMAELIWRYVTRTGIFNSTHLNSPNNRPFCCRWHLLRPSWSLFESSRIFGVTNLRTTGLVALSRMKFHRKLLHLWHHTFPFWPRFISFNSL